MNPSRLFLLGPQRLRPTVHEAVADVNGDGDGVVAVVTAGWEEREPEDVELVEHLARRVLNLRLFVRAEEIFTHDPELFGAMRERYDTLRRLRGLYRRRLDHVLEACRELLGLPGDDELLQEERRAAIESVRALDEHHLQRTREVHAEFEERWRPHEREHVARHRRELEERFQEVSVLCIAGGHVAILLNRLRLFGILEIAGERPVVAWSAGAMALAERIVLFHDSPPQGRVNAEVLEDGLGLARDVVPLPHAKRRLLLDDRVRVSLFARRFGPALCAALDDGSRLERLDGGWSGGPGTQRLTEGGELQEVGRWR